MTGTQMACTNSQIGWKIWCEDELGIGIDLERF